VGSLVLPAIFAEHVPGFFCDRPAIFPQASVQDFQCDMPENVTLHTLSIKFDAASGALKSKFCLLRSMQNADTIRQ